ncbi:hypothetical protein BT96DRAFT_945772 [Gymnopus androsaceus JB14]|uniref:Uncharacterized protein n=1 Tax=Gymnopus androsaceus JB14 TaxID=1447944 RepID=A0A6A4GZT1_9AGAR|nr:hypothetical protein BT96DRAFT_945772 [Gymnopus androsaceus JB14]
MSASPRLQRLGFADFGGIGGGGGPVRHRILNCRHGASVAATTVLRGSELQSQFTFPLHKLIALLVPIRSHPYHCQMRSESDSVTLSREESCQALSGSVYVPLVEADTVHFLRLPIESRGHANSLYEDSGSDCCSPAPPPPYTPHGRSTSTSGVTQNIICILPHLFPGQCPPSIDKSLSHMQDCLRGYVSQFKPSATNSGFRGRFHFCICGRMVGSRQGLVSRVGANCKYSDSGFIRLQVVTILLCIILSDTEQNIIVASTTVTSKE